MNGYHRFGWVDIVRFLQETNIIEQLIMNIWLITIGEPIPHETNKLRLHRTGIIAKYISENSSHNITWWTSTFNHFTKEHIFSETKEFYTNSQLKIIALKGRGYNSNISIDRIIDHQQIAQEFREKAPLEIKPDIIVSSFPTINLCVAAVDFSKKNKIPLLIDYRDMWPDVFIDILPKLLKPIGEFFLSCLFNKTNKILMETSGIIGITESFLNIALQKAKRQRNSFDAVFPLAYLSNQFKDKDYDNAIQFWNNLNIYKEKDCTRICFFGTIGHQFDFDTIIEVARKWTDCKRNIQFVLCGTGDRLEALKKASSNLSNVIFPGYLNAAQIKVLMEISDIGLCPYYPKENFLKSIPGKAIEYLSEGLPLLCSLKVSILGNLIKDNELGYNYESGNIDSLDKAINDFCKLNNSKEKYRQKILKFFHENFDAKSVYKKYMKHLELTFETYNNLVNNSC